MGITTFRIKSQIGHLFGSRHGTMAGLILILIDTISVSFDCICDDYIKYSYPQHIRICYSPDIAAFM